ncbi:RDD family protein [Frigidibacter sp. MR17.14]|uniref:RDD family protein n=1 Tax=Frigidibacter sp. MR17.14 TaxID=3126509 RepID=UPI003012C07F
MSTDTLSPDPFWGLPDPGAEPEFYANVPVKRLFAWVVDVILIGLLTLVAIPFTAFTALFFLPVVFLCLGFVYRWITIANRSATWGMRLMGIELRDRTGRRFDSGMALIHTLGYSLTVAFVIPQILSAVMMATTARGQGLHDIVLGTTAINKPA